MKEKDLTPQEKLAQIQEGLRHFADQFGPNDLLKEAFFDILLESIYDPAGTRNDISLSGQEEQESSANSQCPGKREMPTYEIE